MESMIDNGADWLQPMLDFRNLLASTQDPAVKSQVREHKRRNGQVMRKEDGGIIHGPYKMSVRKDLLRRLLEVQKTIRETGPNATEQLIRPEELHTIRKIWRTEAQDWEDCVPKIYQEVLGESLDWVTDEIPAFSADERKTLDSICSRHDVPSAMVAKLLDVERNMHAMTRRSEVFQKIGAVLDEDWRSEQEVRAIK